MKVESGIKPKNKFMIDNIKGNTCEVVFFDNIIKEKRQKDEVEEEQTIYSYDTYKVNTFYRSNLESDIEKNINDWLNYAKSLDYEKKAKEIRELRNKLLDESDKEMALDRLNLDMPTNVTATTLLSSVKKFFEAFSQIKNNEWAIYRQKLRDITEQEGFPYNVIFPDKPEK